MIFMLMGIVWVVSGVIPGMIVWQHNYNEKLPKDLYFPSALAGPIAGIVHLANWRKR